MFLSVGIDFLRSIRNSCKHHKNKVDTGSDTPFLIDSHGKQSASKNSYKHKTGKADLRLFLFCFIGRCTVDYQTGKKIHMSNKEIKALRSYTNEYCDSVIIKRSAVKSELLINISV